MPRPPSDCPLPAVTAHTLKRGAPAFPYLFPPLGAPGLLCPIAAVSARTRRKPKCRCPPHPHKLGSSCPCFSAVHIAHTVLSARRRALPRPSTRPLDRPPLQPPLPHQAKQLPHLSVLIGRQEPCDRSPSNIGASPQHHPNITPTSPQHRPNNTPAATTEVLWRQKDLFMSPVLRSAAPPYSNMSVSLSATHPRANTRCGQNISAQKTAAAAFPQLAAVLCPVFFSQVQQKLPPNSGSTRKVLIQ